MAKRVLLGLIGFIGAVSLVALGFFAGFLLGALPIAALYAGHILGAGATDALVPLLGLVLGITGTVLAVWSCRRLPTWIHRHRLARMRRQRVSIEAEVTDRDTRYFSYRGSRTWTHRIEVSWPDPLTGEPERIKRRYIFHNEKRSDAFRYGYARSGTKLPVLVKAGDPPTAIIDIPNGPAWTELW